jgi:hypothetical protein
MIVQQAQMGQKREHARVRIPPIAERALMAFEMGIPSQKPPKAAGVAVSEKGAERVAKEKTEQDSIKEWEMRYKRRKMEDLATACAAAVVFPAAIVTGGLMINGHFVAANPILGVALMVVGLVGSMKTIDWFANNI